MLLQRCRCLASRIGSGSIWIDGLNRWSPERCCTAAISQSQIGLQAARITVEVFARAELKGVDEHTHQHWALLCRTADQLPMPLVQPTHGRDELKGLAEAGAECRQLSLR